MPEQYIPFAETLRGFSEEGIRFVVIGGVAMGAHGSSYLTDDVDFVYAADDENVRRLATYLEKIHARILGRPGGGGPAISSELLQRVRFLNLSTDVGEIDVMRETPGIDSFQGLCERAIPMDLGGTIVRVATLDDLIEMKRAANRTKDRMHMNELLALKRLQEEAAHDDE